MRDLILLFAVVALGQINIFAQNDTGFQNVSGEKIKVVFGNDAVEFVSKINDLGAKGYKLVKVTKIPTVDFESDLANETNYSPRYKFYETSAGFAGLMSFEKDVFEYESSERMDPKEIYSVVEDMNKKGFSLVEMFPIWGSKRWKLFGVEASARKVCYDNYFNKISDDHFGSSNIMLFERNASKEKITKEYKMISSEKGGLSTSWNKQTREKFSKFLEEYSRQGFRPISISVDFPNFVLLENDGTQQKETQYNFAESVSDKEITNYSKQGYKPLMFNGLAGSKLDLALFSKTAETSVHFKVLHTLDNRKAYLNDIGELYNAGYRYESSGWSTGLRECKLGYSESVLLFGRNFSSGNFTHRIVKFEENQVFQKKTNKIQSTPNALVVHEIQNLIDQGYILRDIFYSHGINVILDKPRS